MKTLTITIAIFLTSSAANAQDHFAYNDCVNYSMRTLGQSVNQSHAGCSHHLVPDTEFGGYQFTIPDKNYSGSFENFYDPNAAGPLRRGRSGEQR